MRDYYRILDKLGEGAFGEVRKCVYREKSTSKSFYKQYRAVKIISKNHLDEKGEKSFQNEVEMMLDLTGMFKNVDKDKQVDQQTHPSIVKMFHYFEDARRYLLVTELCEKGELFNYIHEQDGKIERDQSALILKQVISAVLFMHKK